MAVKLVAMSHSPLLGYNDPGEEVKQEMEGSFEKVREFVKDYDPDLIINFAPDHYNGFFYDHMPPFCVGFQSLGVGDYDSQEGFLDTPEELAQDLAQFIMDNEVDVAISRRMEIDHGAVQPMEIIYGDIAAKPVIAVYVNGLARPFVPMKRVRLLGKAIGSWAAAQDKKILLISSGGLSHDPPVPQWVTADEKARKLMLNGRYPTPEARAERQERVISTGRKFAAGEMTNILDLNPEWDREFMRRCASGDPTAFDSYTVEGMDREAGHSSHEVRTWVAGFSALAEATGGSYDIEFEYYRAIKEYIAGFGIMLAN